MSRRKPVLPTLVDGKHCSDSTFKALLESLEEHYLIEVYDDRYKPLGTACVKVTERYQADEQGAYVRVRYLGCSDGHYKWYIEQEGKAGGLPSEALHHLCRDDPDKCPAKARGRAPVIHVRRWSPVERKFAHEALKSWGYPGLPMEPAYPPGDHPSRATASKDKRGRSPGDGRGGDAAPHASSKKKAKSAPAAFDDADFGDDDEHEESEEEPPKRKPALKSEQDGLKKFLAQDTALDGMLGSDHDGKGQKLLEDKLEHLRGKLRGSAAAPGSSGKKPGGILARRATENLGKRARDKKKKKKSAGSRVLSEFSKALERKRKGRDYDSSDSYEESSSPRDRGGDDGGGWTSKRKRFKRIAEESPGRLMMQSLEAMEDHLGTRFGGVGSTEEKMSPIVTRYLLSVIVPTLGNKAAKSTMRELRTLALATDLLLKGKSDSAGDVMLQRFKSLCVQVRDGSEKLGPQIELLPDDIVETGGSLEEDTFAREIAYKEGRSREMMQKALHPKNAVV